MLCTSDLSRTVQHSLRQTALASLPRRAGATESPRIGSARTPGWFGISGFKQFLRFGLSHRGIHCAIWVLHVGTRKGRLAGLWVSLPQSQANPSLLEVAAHAKVVGIPAFVWPFPALPCPLTHPSPCSSRTHLRPSRAPAGSTFAPTGVRAFGKVLCTSPRLRAICRPAMFR